MSHSDSFTDEWFMVVTLRLMLRKLKTYKQRVFIKTLYDYLDPHEDFLEQRSEDAKAWLYKLYDYYVKKDKKAFKKA